jgi:hypothetical protein
MSEAETGNSKQSDPMESLRELRDAYLDIWSKTMIEAVNTDGYAQASGAMLDSYLTLSAPYKEIFDKTTLQTLRQFGLPTSIDFSELAGRLTSIELRLDDLDAKLDRMGKLSTPSSEQSHEDVNAKLSDMEKLLNASAEQLRNDIDSKLARMEKLLSLSSEQLSNDLDVKLNRIEAMLTRPQPVHQAERKEPMEPITQPDLKPQTVSTPPAAPIRATVSKPTVPAAQAQPVSRTPPPALKTTASKPNRLDGKKGVK